MGDPLEMIQIDLPEIDRDALLARIQENMRSHNLVDPPSFPVFEVMSSSRRAASHTSASSSLEFDLQQAHEAYTQTWVTMPPLTSRLPLVGRIKQAFHRLVLYYVNLLASQQMVVNAAILRVLNRLVAAPDADLAALQDEIATLRARVAQLEASAKEDVP